MIGGQRIRAPDPFIMLADDPSISASAIGGAHPHAGFET